MSSFFDFYLIYFLDFFFRSREANLQGRLELRPANFN